MWSRCHWLCRSRRSVLHCEIWQSLSDCSPMHRHRQEISNRHDTWRVKRTRAWEGRRCHHDESVETSEFSINHKSESGLERKLERNCLVRRTRSANWSSCNRECRKSMLRLRWKLLVDSTKWWTSYKRTCLETSFPSVALGLAYHESWSSSSHSHSDLRVTRSSSEVSSVGCCPPVVGCVSDVRKTITRMFMIS